MIIGEIIKIALNTIRTNKLRASLTLSGIVIGVFSIIAIMTALAALQKGIESGLTVLGTNTFQIQKMPVINVGGPPSRKYRNRPDITYEQGVQLMERATEYKHISLEDWKTAKVFKYGKNSTNPNMFLGGVSADFLPTNDYSIKEGRFFTDKEVQSARQLLLLVLKWLINYFQKKILYLKKLFLMDMNLPLSVFLKVKGKVLDRAGIILHWCQLQKHLKYMERMFQ